MLSQQGIGELKFSGRPVRPRAIAAAGAPAQAGSTGSTGGGRSGGRGCTAGGRTRGCGHRKHARSAHAARRAQGIRCADRNRVRGAESAHSQRLTAPLPARLGGDTHLSADADTLDASNRGANDRPPRERPQHPEVHLVTPVSRCPSGSARPRRRQCRDHVERAVMLSGLCGERVSPLRAESLPGLLNIIDGRAETPSRTSRSGTTPLGQPSAVPTRGNFCAKTPAACGLTTETSVEADPVWRAMSTPHLGSGRARVSTGGRRLC
jgi:hypothetical protein